MSLEVRQGTLDWPDQDELDGEDPEDRVMHTASDRPNTATLPALTDPAADHVDPQLAARRADVDEKHQRVNAFLDAHGLDALVLGRTDSVAWFTCGGDLPRMMGCELSSVLLYINRNCRAIISDNVQSPRAFEEEVAGLGFQLKERPWYDEPARVVAELGHNKKVAADFGLPPWPNELPRIRPLRLSLTRRERQILRELGRSLTLAIEATCRNFKPGETEAAIAGHLAHRLLRDGIVPVDLRVAADDRLARYRHPTFKAAQIRRRATISAVGRRQGLCASATRTVSFGPIEPEVRAAHGIASMVAATCIYFSRPGETIAEVFRRARRIYEKFGHPDEWMLDYQGSLIGYSPCEATLLPESPLVIPSDAALCWGPSVGATRSEDTVVVDRRGLEIVTEAQSWPKFEVMVKGFAISRPGILER